MNSTAIATIQKDDYEIMLDQSERLLKTGFLPQAIKTPQQALAIIMQGRELGIGAMASLQTINVIQGKPTISPQLMLALINKSGQLEDMQMTTGEEGADVLMKRKGRTPYSAHFGPDEARAMGLFSKDNYKKQAPVMFQWRAVAACARVVFPDVILGLYTPDEMGGEMDPETGAYLAEPVHPTNRQLIAAAHSQMADENGGSDADDGERLELIEKAEVFVSGLDLDEVKAAKTLGKFRSLRTADEMHEALHKLQLAVYAKDRAELTAQCVAGFTEQQWDESDQKRYLTDRFQVESLAEATLDRLRAIADDLGVVEGAKAADAAA